MYLFMSQYARVERWDGDKGRGREYPEIGAVTERQEHQVDADHDVDVDVDDVGGDDADPDEKEVCAQGHQQWSPE